ncbi:MAG: class I SAM-dependent RNA methyltransferase [Alphaproteobacteria bacterium]|nr:class I SAM-dependent RNA methyltransferase [Alphaproteobacteria bacterium]
MCKTCPFFGICGGCKYDFTAPDYHDKKLAELRNINITEPPIWIAPGTRRRADFCFGGGRFGFYKMHSKDIIPIDACPLLCDEINAIIPHLRAIPFDGAGSCLVTLCDNGVDVAITSNVTYFSAEMRGAVNNLPVIRVSWNGNAIQARATPRVSFGTHSVEYPIGAFLQPTIPGADALRDMVVRASHGAQHIADLFCGLGNFTFATNADGFDIVGPHIRRDLFRQPVTRKMLNQYDCVIMDPPRAGADAQCRELAHANVPRVIYVSCNPQTFIRDTEILTRAGYRTQSITPVDQFVGSRHWEICAVFGLHIDD